VICLTCARAADRHAPRDQHCNNPGCACGHRVQRYRATTEQIATPTTPPDLSATE
jgi:hypothetical protein